MILWLRPDFGRWTPFSPLILCPPPCRTARLSLNCHSLFRLFAPGGRYGRTGELGLTRTITILALGCLLLAGAAVTTILGRDSVPAALVGMTTPTVNAPVVSNREGKADRLAVAVRLATAAVEQPPATTASFSEPLRQAYAATTPADIEAAKAVSPQPEPPAMATVPAEPVAPAAPPKPKAAAKPQPQKSYALLSDGQIAGIKERLKLSASQEYYWPAVESALRAVARKIHATKQADPAASTPPIDPESPEVQQLKSAAMPLLFQLREDQKEEVRRLARIIGLEQVASAI